MPHKADETSSNPPRKRTRSSNTATVTPAPEDAHRQTKDGNKQKQTAWEVVAQAYPSVLGQYPTAPERTQDVFFLASRAASKEALAYADNLIRPFELASGSTGGHNRKLKAALAQAAGIPTRFVSASGLDAAWQMLTWLTLHRTSCDQCAAGKGLWKACSQAPTQPGGAEDVFGGACASCFYYVGRSRCTWSSRPSTATSSHEGSVPQPKESNKGETSKPENSPAPKRRKVLSTHRRVLSNHRNKNADPPKDSIVARTPKATNSTSPPPPLIEPSESPLPRILSDLKPKSRTESRPRKAACSRPPDTLENSGALDSTQRQATPKSRGDGPIPNERGDDEGWKDRRIIDLEQERDEYQAALQKEKAKTKQLGEQSLSLESTILTGKDEKQALQEELTYLRGYLKKQEASHASAIDKLSNEVTALAEDKANEQKKASETQDQLDRLKRKVSNGAEEIYRLRDQLSSAQAAQVLQISETKQQAEAVKNQHATRIKDLEEQLVKSTASIEDGKLELRKAGEKHDHLTKDLQRLRSAEAALLPVLELKIILQQQLKDAEKKLEAIQASKAQLQREYDVQGRMMREQEDKALAMAAMVEDFRANSDALGQSLTQARSSLEKVDMKVQALQASEAQLKGERDDQTQKMREREDEARTMSAKIEEHQAKGENMALALHESVERQKTVAKEIREVFAIWATGRLD